jgi:hypothetical protein
MPTSRTPINRPPQRPTPTITPKAIELFVEWETTECTCPPRDWGGEYWKHRRCDGCERCRELHEQLIDELGARPTKPWEALEIMRPDSSNPYPSTHVNAPGWKPDRKGQALYRLLERTAAAPSGGRPRRRRRPDVGL